MWINNYSQEPTKRTSLRWHHYSGLPWYNGRIKWVLRPGTIMHTFVCSVGDKTKQQGIWKASSVAWSPPIPSAQRAAISSYSLTDNDQGFFHLAPTGSCFFSPPSALSLCMKANLGGGIPSSDRIGLSKNHSEPTSIINEVGKAKAHFFENGEVVMLHRTAACCLGGGK